VFSRAKGASEFEFIMCLLRVRGMEDSGNDPWFVKATASSA